MKKDKIIKSSKKRKDGDEHVDVVMYSYDSNGNQIRADKSRVESENFRMGFYEVNENSGYGYENFTYNGLDQLVKYDDEKGNTAEYEYMADGLRLSKTVNGEKTSFIWDGNEAVIEITGNTLVSYVKDPGFMRKGEATGEPYKCTFDYDIYLFDGHGNVTGITDRDGNLQKEYEYDAFGNEIAPDSNDENPFRYCGEYKDSETGLIYLRNRYYDPETGRFINEDPIRSGGNWYVYCDGNPVTFLDSFGLMKMVNGKTKDKYKKGSGSKELNTYESKDIKKMQEKLQELGYLDSSFTNYGYFDSDTEKAVNSYKNDRNLKNDTINTYGIVGATTWQALGLDFDLYTEDNTYLATVRFNESSLEVDSFKGEIYNNTKISITDETAKAIKKGYESLFGKELYLSYESISLEIQVHVELYKLYENNPQSSIYQHTRIVNIGNGYMDEGIEKDRYVWDFISLIRG